VFTRACKKVQILSAELHGFLGGYVKDVKVKELEYKKRAVFGISTHTGQFSVYEYE